MINSSKLDSPRQNTFEERVTKIQDQVSRFVEVNKSARSDSQIYRSNEPSTSSGVNLKETRHHYIPGDKIFRDVFMKMLSNREHWPYMVQLLNVALENYRYHGIDRKINIINAQNALDMFDARILECYFDVDCLFEALDDLYAVFYWTPFNIHYGPNARYRAPPDPGNKTDEEFSHGFDFITLCLLDMLENNLKTLEISDITVKLYILLLLGNPTPKFAGRYSKISSTLRCYIENYLQNLGLQPNTEAFEETVSKLKEHEIVNINGKQLTLILMYMTMLAELKVAEACKDCINHAENSINELTVDGYKCRVKKCPLFAEEPKYVYNSSVKTNSVMDIGKLVLEIMLHFSLKQVAECLQEVNLRNLGETSKYTASQSIFDQIFDKLSVDNIRNSLKSTKYEEFFEFLFLTENLDREYKKLKGKTMNMNMSQELLQMSIK